MTDPAELEPAIMNNNFKRLHLTDDIPLMGESIMHEELVPGCNKGYGTNTQWYIYFSTRHRFSYYRIVEATGGCG